MRYHVQEFVGRKWYTVRSFATRDEAQSWIGPNTYKIRIKEFRI